MNSSETWFFTASAQEEWILKAMVTALQLNRVSSADFFSSNSSSLMALVTPWSLPVPW